MQNRYQTCAWCGKLFSKTTKAKYCSKECCKAVREAIKKAKATGVVLSADGVILKHKLEMERENPTQKRKVLTPTHTSSSGMTWIWREEE